MKARETGRAVGCCRQFDLRITDVQPAYRSQRIQRAIDTHLAPAQRAGTVVHHGQCIAVISPWSVHAVSSISSEGCMDHGWLRGCRKRAGADWKLRDYDANIAELFNHPAGSVLRSNSGRRSAAPGLVASCLMLCRHSC